MCAVIRVKLLCFFKIFDKDMLTSEGIVFVWLQKTLISLMLITLRKRKEIPEKEVHCFYNFT